MKLKLDAEGHAVLQDGKPVYIHDDGKEVAFDAPATVATIARLNGESKSHRERAEAAEVKAKAFDGIEDAGAARKALETVKNLDAKKLVDAGEVEKVKAEVVKAMDEKYGPVVKERDDLLTGWNAEKIGNAFLNSKFVAEKIAVPVDLIRNTFGQRFAIEKGQIVANDGSGNPVYSRSSPGERAGFDEAIELLVDAYPHKDSILKARNPAGAGTQPNGSPSGAAPRGNIGGNHADRVAALQSKFPELPRS